MDPPRVTATPDTISGHNRVTLRHDVALQKVEAPPVGGGQDPDTITKHHNPRLTWNCSASPYTDACVTAGYQRIGSLWDPEETSLGTFYLFNRVLQSIGPSNISIGLGPEPLLSWGA